MGGKAGGGGGVAAAAALWIALAVGCQPRAGSRGSLAMAQTPPTVRAAYEQYYAGVPVRSVTRESRGGQAYYTVDYGAADGPDHSVVFNEAGNEIDKR